MDSPREIKARQTKRLAKYSRERKIAVGLTGGEAKMVGQWRLHAPRGAKSKKKKKKKKLVKS